ncbi:hypothetical protein ACET3X_006335 [Alternaria dauci]|uniref:2EXR domain-containing protein n=1 Tax=Alternaria dauci TaxID=48095 RepID=A0ABR3UHZ8_9PLEO
MWNNAPVLSSVLGHTEAPATAPPVYFSTPNERFARVSTNTTATTDANVEVATKVKRPTKAKRAKKADPKQQTGFHPFPRLPAELRTRIWAMAVNDQIELAPQPFHLWVLRLSGNSIIIHEHEEKDGNKHLSVTTTRGYPALFQVNREARYEAVKADGGAWYDLGGGALQVYANFGKERVYVASCCSSSGLRGSPLQSKAHGGVFCISDVLSG